MIDRPQSLQMLEQSGSEPEDPKRRLSPRHPGLLVCSLGLAGGSIGLAASRLGQLWVGFDVFAQCTLQFAVVTAACAVALTMPRARALTAIVLIVFGALAIGLWPHFASREQLPAAEAQAGKVPLTIATFNIWDGNRQRDAIVAEVLRLDADVIAIVETGRQGPALAAQLHTKYPYQADCFDNPLCDLAILSRHPLAARQSRVSWAGPSAVLAQLGPELGNLTIVAVHTLRFPHSRAQLHQIQALGTWLETIPGERVVMGDFNATPFSRMLQTFSEATGLTRLTELPSWPSWVELPQAAIDHIFVSAGLNLLRGESIGNPAGSDHYPVALTVSVPVR